MRISDWSSDVCSSDLVQEHAKNEGQKQHDGEHHPTRQVRLGDRLGNSIQRAGHAEQLTEKRRRGHDDQNHAGDLGGGCQRARSEEHTSELQSLMRISYAVFCLKKKIHNKRPNSIYYTYRQLPNLT